jgi:predicted phage-related endonuclease
MKLTAANDEIRARNVTASEVAALLPGGHPYTDPQTIYDRLTGAGADRGGSEAMEMGSFFEASILRFAERRDGFRARLNARTIEHATVRLCATPDAWLLTRHPTAMVPERALIELKMSGRIELWRDLPSHVEHQARAQLACTGRDVVYVYVLVGMSLRVFSVYREADKETALLAAVQRFWADHIVAGVRPGPADPVPPMIFSFEADPAIREKEAVPA